MKLYLGSSCAHMAEKISLPKGKLLVKEFPNDETYVRIFDKPENCFLVQSTKTDSDIVELILALDAFNDYGVKPNLIIPYFGYSKQDKRFEDGEAISAKAIMKIFSEKAGKIFLIDPHIFRGEGEFNFFGTTIEAVSLIPMLAAHAKKMVHQPLILSPDMKASKHAKQFENILGGETFAFEKIRARGSVEGNVYEARISEILGETYCKGKDVLIVDDMIVTGGTIVKAIEKIKQQSPAKIIVCAVHGAFIEGALQKILSAGASKVFTTDTIKNPAAEVSVAPLIEEIVKTHE